MKNVAASYPRFLPAGDTGLVVELGDGIDGVVNARVRALDRAVAAAAIAGVVETLPTNRSLFVRYEPLALGHDGLKAVIAALIEGLPERPDQNAGRSWVVPVVYGGSYGIDLEAAAAALRLDPADLVARHAAGEYRVFMIGFQPGFAYLGSLDPALSISRRAEPRAEIPAGTVSIAGIQTVINSVAAPSGWNLIGQTPARLFDLRRGDPFLLAAGDRVRFRPVPQDAWADLAARAEAGETVAEPAP